MYFELAVIWAMGRLNTKHIMSYSKPEAPKYNYSKLFPVKCMPGIVVSLEFKSAKSGSTSSLLHGFPNSRFSLTQHVDSTHFRPLPVANKLNLHPLRIIILL